MTIELLKKEAKKMIFSGKYTQKEIARKLGVRPNTVSDWVKRYNWRKETEKSLYEDTDPLLAYLRFLRQKHPATYQSILTTFKEFKNR